MMQQQQQQQQQRQRQQHRKRRAAQTHWVPFSMFTEHYYDDNDTCEPDEAATSGQDALVELCGNEYFGFSYDPGKDVVMKARNEYLGVVSDLGRVDEGVVTMDVSAKRRKKIKALLTKL